MLDATPLIFPWISYFLDEIMPLLNPAFWVSSEITLTLFFQTRLTELYSFSCN